MSTLMPLGRWPQLCLTFVILQCKIVVICCLSCQAEGKLMATGWIIFINGTDSLNYLGGKGICLVLDFSTYTYGYVFSVVCKVSGNKNNKENSHLYLFFLVY